MLHWIEFWFCLLKRMLPLGFRITRILYFIFHKKVKEDVQSQVNFWHPPFCVAQIYLTFVPQWQTWTIVLSKERHVKKRALFKNRTYINKQTNNFKKQTNATKTSMNACSKYSCRHKFICLHSSISFIFLLNLLFLKRGTNMLRIWILLRRYIFSVDSSHVKANPPRKYCARQEKWQCQKNFKVFRKILI